MEEAYPVSTRCVLEVWNPFNNLFGTQKPYFMYLGMIALDVYSLLLYRSQLKLKGSIFCEQTTEDVSPPAA